MDYRQQHIFNNILEKNHIKNENIKFKQYRNLKEFKYFIIERVNPNHKIKIYGVLKNNDKKKNNSKHFINVGEITIGIITIYCNLKILADNIDFICLLFCMYFLNCFLFYWFGKLKIWRMIKSLSELKGFWVTVKQYIWFIV